jgi:hypothetical protein
MTLKRIRQLIAETADLATTASFSVHPEEFADWMSAVAAHHFTACLDENGRVHAFVHENAHGTWFQVHCHADVLDGHELPPYDSDSRFATLPAEDASRLQMFEAAKVGGDS